MRDIQSVLKIRDALKILYEEDFYRDEVEGHLHWAQSEIDKYIKENNHDKIRA